MDDKYWRLLDPANRRILKVPDSAIVHAAPRTVEIDISTFQLFRSSVAMNITNLVKFLSKVCKTNICSDAMGSLNVNGTNIWFSRIVIKVPVGHAIHEWAKTVFGSVPFNDLTVVNANGSTVYLGEDFLWLWSPNKMRHTSEVRATNRDKCQCASCAVRFNQQFDNFPPRIIDEVVDADVVPSLIPNAEQLPASETKPHELLYLMLTTDVYGQFTHDAKRCPVTFDSGKHPNWLKDADVSTDEVQAAHLDRAQKVSNMLNVSLHDAGEMILKYNAARFGLPINNEALHRCRKRLTESAERAGVDPSAWLPGALDDEEQRVMSRIANTAYFATHFLEHFSQSGSKGGVGPVGGRTHAIDVDLQRSRPRAVPSALLRDAEGQRNPHIATAPIWISDTGFDDSSGKAKHQPPTQLATQSATQPTTQPARSRQRLAHGARRPTDGDGGLWLPPELWELIFGVVADGALTNPTWKAFHVESIAIAQVNKLARATLYRRAAVMIKPAMNAVETFCDLEAAKTEPVDCLYDFLGCCDALRLSTVSMMKMCSTHAMNRLKSNPEDAGRESFRLLHSARKRRAEAMRNYTEVNSRRGNVGRPEGLEITTEHRNALPTVTMARKSRTFRVKLDVNATDAPKSHALLHNLQCELLV